MKDNRLLNPQHRSVADRARAHRYPRPAMTASGRGMNKSECEGMRNAGRRLSMSMANRPGWGIGKGQDQPAEGPFLCSAKAFRQTRTTAYHVQRRGDCLNTLKPISTGGSPSEGMTLLQELNDREEAAPQKQGRQAVGPECGNLTGELPCSNWVKSDGGDVSGGFIGYGFHTMMRLAK